MQHSAAVHGSCQCVRKAQVAFLVASHQADACMLPGSSSHSRLLACRQWQMRWLTRSGRYCVSELSRADRTGRQWSVVAAARKGVRDMMASQRAVTTARIHTCSLWAGEGHLHAAAWCKDMCRPSMPTIQLCS